MSASPRSHASAGTQGPAAGLFRSLGNMLHTALTVAQTRFELLTTEVQEEIQRAAKLLVWAFAALICGFMGLMLLSLTIVFVFWDTHRLAAAVSVTVVFFVLAGVAGAVLAAKLKSRPRLLDATLTELARDRDELKTRLGSAP
jgi:uncharacterized membrane protein YqjE